MPINRWPYSPDQPINKESEDSDRVADSDRDEDGEADQVARRNRRADRLNEIINKDVLAIEAMKTFYRREYNAE